MKAAYTCPLLSGVMSRVRDQALQTPVAAPVPSSAAIIERDELFTAQTPNKGKVFFCLLAMALGLNTWQRNVSEMLRFLAPQPAFRPVQSSQPNLRSPATDSAFPKHHWLLLAAWLLHPPALIRPLGRRAAPH